jgi:hypothetical protein
VLGTIFASPPSMNYKKSDDRFQGFIFAYELRSDALHLRLLRCIRLATIPLAEVKYMRLSARREFLDFSRQKFWPMFLTYNRGQNPLYVIRTLKGVRYFLRFSGKFHYKVRTAIGRHLSVPNASNHSMHRRG